MSQATDSDRRVTPPIRGTNGEFLHADDFGRAGVHTIALAYRDGDVLESEPAFAGPTWDAQTGDAVWYGSMYDQKTLRHTGTGLRLDLKRHPRGFLLTATGEAASLLAEDKRVDGLIATARLRDVKHAIRAQTARMGVVLPPDAPLAVRRADLATDLSFEATMGLDVIRGLAALPVPRHEGATFAVAGSPTVLKAVSWQRRRQVEMVVYDRGRDRATAASGTLLRLERRYRPRCRATR